MGYDFYGFNPWDFEELVQALFQKILGNSSLVYGLGADGGRELSFRGGAAFASPQQFQDGLWIVQAKFRSRSVHDHEQYDWVSRQFKDEMRKFRSGKYPVPDQYIFVTNAVLTPAYQRGGRDKMEALAAHYKDTIPSIYIVAYDELCKLLLNNADVRQAYQHWLSPGDEMAQIKQILAQQAIHQPFVLAGKEIREVPVQHNYTFSLPANPILAIDFGTSYSLCGVIGQRGTVELVPTAGGKMLLHSCISFFQNGSYIVGNPQLAQINTGEILSFSQIKRYLVSDKHFDIFGTRYTAAQLATLIISSLKTSAEEYFGYTFSNVVVAKPANFNLRQTKMLTDIFERAGFKVRRMLDEGTAPCYLFPKALLQYATLLDPVRFLIMDLGGGTFDLSVQELGDGVYETKAVLGDNKLGGIDYDLAVLALAEKKMKLSYPALSNKDFTPFLFEAERVKKGLSTSERVSFMITDHDLKDGNLADFSVEITRDEFRECTSALNVQVMRCLNDILRMASANETQQTEEIYKIDALMLTGQGAKIFTVRELIENVHPDIPIIDQFMENAVCLGNGSQAGVLQGIVKDELLLSVHNSGLVIKARDLGFRDKYTKRLVISMAPTPELNTRYCTLLHPSTTVPTKDVFEFQVRVNNLSQKEFNLPIYETGTRGADMELAQELCTPVNQGVNDIRLTLDIDANHRVIFIFKNVTTGFSRDYVF